MPVVLNISDGRALPESELEALRNIARSNQSDTLIVGSRSLRLHHVSFMDAFSVEPIQGSLLDRLGGGVVALQRVWRDSLIMAILSCRRSVYIWSRFV